MIMDIDTVAVFSKEQVKELAKMKIEWNMYKELSDSCIINSSIMERKIYIQQEMIKILEEKDNNNKTIISNYDKMISSNENIIKDKDKIIKAQRVKTLIITSITVLTTILLIWK